LVYRIKDRTKSLCIILCILLIYTHSNKVVSSPDYELTIKIVDQSSFNRPIAKANVSLINRGFFETNQDGYIRTNLPAGIYDIIVRWKSIYNQKPVIIAVSSVILDKSINVTIPASVYDVKLQLITPLGERPIANAIVNLSSVPLNITNAEGQVYAEQVPNIYAETNPSYPVTAILFGVDISPDPVIITSSKTYVLRAKKITNLTVQVVGTQGQGINAVRVEIKNNAGMSLFNGTSNEQGIVRVEIPWGHYNITINYRNYIYNSSVEVSSNIGYIRITTDIFIIILDQAMTFMTFMIMIIIIVVSFVIILVVGYFLVKRRKKRKSEVKICPLCGEKLELDARFCIKCGTHQLTMLEKGEER